MAPPPPGFGFYGHPDWQLIGRDDALIAKYDLTKSGFGHTTEKVIRGSNDGLPIEAFIHRWKTQRTETYTDSDGKQPDPHGHRRSLRDPDRDHDAILVSVALGRGRLGWQEGPIRERGIQRSLHRAHRRSQFASDVIHPRTMEFLMARQPPGFRIEGNRDALLWSTSTTHS